MVIASRNERRTRRRAERCGMELCIAQTGFGNAVEGGRRDDTSKCSRNAVTLIVSHNEQNVWRTLGWHDLRWPPGLRLVGLEINRATELWRLWRQIRAIDRRRRTG